VDHIGGHIYCVNGKEEAGAVARTVVPWHPPRSLDRLLRKLRRNIKHPYFFMYKYIDSLFYSSENFDFPHEVYRGF